MRRIGYCLPSLAIVRHEPPFVLSRMSSAWAGTQEGFQLTRWRPFGESAGSLQGGRHHHPNQERGEIRRATAGIRRGQWRFAEGLCPPCAASLATQEPKAQPQFYWKVFVG